MVTTRALRIVEPGGPEGLQLSDLEVGDPGPNEIRVRVHASGVNRADILQRMGFYPAPEGVPPDVPGLEYAGEVDAVGRGVRNWQPGDRVMGLVGGGAYAQHLIAHARTALPIPGNVDFAHAAAFPEAFTTAWDALQTPPDVRTESVLIHAVGSGVGTAAVQLADAPMVLGTSRTPEKLERAKELGLTVGIHTAEPRFADVCHEHTENGVAFILDLIGGAYLEENLAALRTRGHLVVIGLLGGTNADLPLRTLMSKRITMRGSVLRSRPTAEKIELAERIRDAVLPGLAAGKLRPVVDQVFDAKDAGAAHEHMTANAPFGNLVLQW